MSCFYRTPRSATVVADRDCYVLEVLRNILDQLKKDVKFKKRLDDDYRKRTLDLQVRNIPLFQDLGDDLLVKIRDKAELKNYVAGQVLCDEHERSEEMFLVRGGLVKVVKGVSSLFTPADAARWKPPADGRPAGTALAKLWSMAPEDARTGPGDLAALPEERRARPPTPSTRRSRAAAVEDQGVRGRGPLPLLPGAAGAAAGRRQAPPGTGRPLAEPGAGGDRAVRRLDVPAADGRFGDGAALRRPGRADRRDRPDDRRSPQRHLRGLYPPARGAGPEAGLQAGGGDRRGRAPRAAAVR